jgi:polyhydroxyalkanoate synthesis repressor PhaR
MLVCSPVPRRTPPPKTASTAKRRRGRPPRHPSDADQQFPGARVIKRYGNRRLYDAKLSRCVTMDEIADFVRKGEDVRVLDGDSGEDLTKRVLTQIILETQNARQLELLPVELLRKIISARSDATARWMEQYLGAMAQFLERSKESIDSLFPWMKQSPWPAQEPPPPPPAAKDESLRDEMAELERRLADLASRMNRR